MTRLLLVTALGLVVALPAGAQQQGTWEIGGFGRWNRYDKSFDQVDSTKNKNSFGGGARVGYFFSPRWSLEADGSANATDVNRVGGAQSIGLVYWPFHLRALYHAPAGERFSWILGGGLNYNRYDISDEQDDFLTKTFQGDDWGVGALTGFRYKLSEWVSLRVDGTLDFIPSPQNEANGSNTMLGAQAGLSLFLGAACSDKLDSIRVEPRTATVTVGEQVNYRVIGYLCDGTMTDAAAGTSGSATGGTLTGTSFSSNTPGTFQLTFTNAAARKRRTADATVTVNPRPAPPPPALTRVDLQPDNATIFINETVPLRVIGHWSDGSSRELTNCQLTPDGGTVSNGVYTATVAGTYTVTATCEAGRSDRSTITVRTINITLRALFRFDRTQVYIQAEIDSLKALARTLQEHPSLQLTIYGHTDWVGSTSYNDRLGSRRVQAVVDSLRSYGVPQSRLDGFVKRSFGECHPVADNRTSDGRALNRRVEVFDTPSAKQYDGGASCRERP